MRKFVFSKPKSADVAKPASGGFSHASPFQRLAEKVDPVSNGIFIGLAIETINTAVEKLADAVDMNFNEHIKIAKDVSAGAMLFFAMGAFITACIIFLPKIFN